MNIKTKLCLCGCGLPVTQRRDGTYNDFINHHHIRVNNPAKTESFKEKMRGENNPSKRPEVKAKISKSLKGVYSGEKNHMKQEKYRKLFSEMFSGKKNPMYGRINPGQSERMKKNNPMSKISKEKRRKTLQHRMKLSQSKKKKNGITEENKIWNKFITPLNEKIRKTIEYREWRENIYKRDKYICQICQYCKGKILNVHHHKIKFSDIIIKNNITTLGKAKKCKELWDINNGITICKKCHEKIHKKG